MVGGGGCILMAVLFELAGETGVFLVLQKTMGPTVGRVGAKVGATRCGCGCRLCWWLFDGSICAVVTGAAGGGGAMATVLVRVAKMSAERSEGFVGIGFAAPFAASYVEKTRGVDDVVADANYRGFTWCVVPGCGEADADVELRE